MTSTPPELLRHHRIDEAPRVVERSTPDRRQVHLDITDRKPMRANDRLPELGDRAIRSITDVTLALRTVGPLQRRDPRILALLESLDALAAGVKAVDRRRTDASAGAAARTWLVGRDASRVIHAVDPDSQWSACGMVGFGDIERRDWRSVRGPRCIHCEGEAS